MPEERLTLTHGPVGVQLWEAGFAAHRGILAGAERPSTCDRWWTNAHN